MLYDFTKYVLVPHSRHEFVISSATHECSDASNDARSRFHTSERKQSFEAAFMRHKEKQVTLLC